MSEKVAIETRRFGRIEVEAEDVIRFEDGIPGFPEAHRYAVLEHSQESLFGWLVSLDQADLAFVITSPWHFFPDYDPPVEARHLRRLGVEREEDLEIVTLAILSDGAVRLNLAAPVLIHGRSKRGLQLVPERTRYSTREPIPAPEAAPGASPDAPGGGGAGGRSGGEAKASGPPAPSAVSGSRI